MFESLVVLDFIVFVAYLSLVMLESGPFKVIISVLDTVRRESSNTVMVI